MQSELLEIKEVSKAFGGVRALERVSFKMSSGKIKSLIGPNGAGKTTTLNLISGIFPYDSGDIVLNGRNMTDLHPHRITELGVGRTFQDGGLFSNMTVLENVLVGFHCKTRAGLLTAMLRPIRANTEQKRAIEQATALLDVFDLADKRYSSLESLPLREQRMVEIASALANDPSILLLDEPSAGLNETEVHGLREILFQVREQGINILLVEHNMDLVMKVSDEIVVLDYGVVLAEGSPNVIQKDERVIKAYLGE